MPFPVLKAVRALLAGSGFQQEHWLSAGISWAHSKVGHVQTFRAGLVLDAGPSQLVQIVQKWLRREGMTVALWVSGAGLTVRVFRHVFPWQG